MPKLVPSFEEMVEFLTLLKRYSQQCRIHFKWDSNLGRGSGSRPRDTLPALKSLIHQRLETLDFLTPFGWAEAVNQAFERLRSGELYYNRSRFEDIVVTDQMYNRKSEERNRMVKDLMKRFNKSEAEVRKTLFIFRDRNKDPTGVFPSGNKAVFNPGRAEAVLEELERLIKELETLTSAELRYPGPVSPPQVESECQIVSTLRDVGHRCTTQGLLSEMRSRGLDPAESTVKKRLARMTKEVRLHKDPKAKPPGYGLPEWGVGSIGSSGS